MLSQGASYGSLAKTPSLSSRAIWLGIATLNTCPPRTTCLAAENEPTRARGRRRVRSALKTANGLSSAGRAARYRAGRLGPAHGYSSRSSRLSLVRPARGWLAAQKKKTGDFLTV